MALVPTVPRQGDLVSVSATVVLTVSIVALVVVDLQQGTLRAATTPISIGWWLAAFVGFGLAAWSNERRPIPLWWLWTVAVALRLVLVATEPSLSDDVYRYLWDGHLVGEGISPYAHPINAAALDPVEIPVRRLANNEWLASPYLPTAQGLFGLIDAVAPASPRAVQLTMVALDLITIGLLTRLLTMAGMPSERVVLYAWNPLVIVELAHGAHLDGLMVMLTMAAVVRTLRPDGASSALRPDGAGVLLALAATTRPIPLLLLPALWPRWGWGRRLGFGATVAALLLPFGLGPSGWGLDARPEGTGLFGSAAVYSRQFRFNGALTDLLEPGTLPATVVSAGVMAAVGLVVWRRSVGVSAALDAGAGAVAVRRLLRLAVVPVVAYVVLTPVLHPWYLVLLLALLPFLAPAPGEAVDRWLLLGPWLYLAAAVSLSYLTYRNPDRFAELAWVRRVEWYPTLLMAAAAVFWVYFAVQAADSGGPVEPEQRIDDGDAVEVAVTTGADAEHDVVADAAGPDRDVGH